MAYQSWSVVFGEQPSAAKWNILGANDAYFDSIVGSGTAWDTWTPTLSGRLDDGDWTKECKYIQIGKTVHFTLTLIATAAAPMGGGSATSAVFTLPVTAAAIPGTDTRVPMGVAFVYDASATSVFNAPLTHTSTTTATIFYWNTSQVLSGITSTAPFTWTTSDEISAIGRYEAA